MICLCGEEFKPTKNAKTCSPQCSAVRAVRRNRRWHEDHPGYKQATYHTPITCAVRLLFAAKGDDHVT